MEVYVIDHVQLAMPADEEEKTRAFYTGALGIIEQPKLPNLAKRGGTWFVMGKLKIYLRVEKDFARRKRLIPTCWSKVLTV